MAGWIKIYRSIQKHWIFEDAEKFKAWNIILFTVNYEPKKVNIKNTLLQCDRGESLMSLESWAKAFGNGWNKSKVRRFFILLENDSMIVTKSEHKTTRLTVCNYESYQDERNVDETQVKRKRNTSETQTTPTKERKEVEERKEIIDVLNSKTGKSFKYSTDKTISCINARFNEGFTIDDFKKVIEIKSKQWINTDNDKYLRPETLFGTKFEGYLNEVSNTKPKDLFSKDGKQRFKVKYKSDTRLYIHTEEEILKHKEVFLTEPFQKQPYNE